MRKIKFNDYIVYEDGIFINKYGRTLSHRIVRNRKEIRLVDNGERKCFISARLIYCLFNGIKYEELGYDNCISFYNGDSMDIRLSNLELISRSDVIRVGRNMIEFYSPKNVKGYMIKFKTGDIKYIYPVTKEYKNNDIILVKDMSEQYIFELKDIEDILEFE